MSASSSPSLRRPGEAFRSDVAHSHSRRKRHVDADEAFSFVLRAAFLTHLLQPRAKRLQHISAPVKNVTKSSASINELVKDFSLIRDSKSTRFPHAFPAELDKRLTGILYGTERMQEYKDPSVKRTFGVFMNEFKNPTFRKTVETSRRFEDLLLIFFSKATAELQKGKTPEDDAWKLMVDRHVALFVRLISSVLKANDWTRDRPELASRLQDLENKLLSHSQDLAHTASNGTSVEVEVPVSFEVKDMPGVLKAAKIFGRTYEQVQSEIDANRGVWTPEEALKDLKIYQMHLSLRTRRTLNSDDFDTYEAYDLWRKAEIHDLTQMMLAIIQAYPDLAKHSSGNVLLNTQSKPVSSADSGYADDSNYVSKQHESNYLIDQPVDVSHLSLDGDEAPARRVEDDAPFTFIPPEPRLYYTAVLRKALSNDIGDDETQPTEQSDGSDASRILSKQSVDVLNEIAIRWRIPSFSRLVLFLDAMRNKFKEREVAIEMLDQAFVFVKNPQNDLQPTGKSQSAQHDPFDRSRWTVTDFAKNQEILTSVHDMLLRELYDLMQHCYETKAPSIGVVMYILENHIYEDDVFTRTTDDLDDFSEQLSKSLRQKAQEVYTVLLSSKVPDEADKWEFYHVIELGKAVMALADKIQKRYRKNPVVMGVSPFDMLVEQILPSYSLDARDIVLRIVEISRKNALEIPVTDGFELYKSLVHVRTVQAQALPKKPFSFDVEHLLAPFVWRWIAMTDEKTVSWVEEAVKQDDFKPKANDHDPDAQRHSSSALDMFRIFSQSINQISDLNWDNDLQYAKFMTAVSKSMGNAICRYCELLEQRFVREMDAAPLELQNPSKQSTQERWMQMARETMSSKEKVEPYQFNPESLVKLNNIEYTTMNLDRLEKEINVDALAAIVAKATPATPKTRQPTQFVFTIKIIEAEDLRACDMNGLSDPYVVLGDEYQKRLAKTRIIPATLNPRWDETVDIITSGPLTLIATIWDWDTLGDHDCVGRTTLKLDPSHFADFLPKEYWLDLDTQGRLLLRVSMEGERDDIQFYFGKTFRQLKRTERDMTRKITDKLLAYIQQCLSKRALRSLLGQGISVSSVRAIAGGYFQRAQGRPMSVAGPPPPVDPITALQPLFDYFDDNFRLMKQTLTDPSMLMVMTRLWKEVLTTIESLLVPPLSDKPSQQKSLTSQEVDIVYKWLKLLFDFFHAENEGVPLDVLRSPKYHDLQNLAFFYFEPTEHLIRTSERMASQTMARQQATNRMSAPPGSLLNGSALGVIPNRRTKSIMLSRNLGTIKKVKEEKRKEAQAEPSDDMILRILRMRPEAERYLKDRSRQKERLAANAAAEMIVRQSILAQRQENGVGVGPGGRINGRRFQ